MDDSPKGTSDVEITPEVIKVKCVDAVVGILEWHFNGIECGFPNWEAHSLATRIVVAVSFVQTGKEPPSLP